MKLLAYEMGKALARLYIDGKLDAAFEAADTDEVDKP
jgi:hypothetical protein